MLFPTRLWVTPPKGNTEANFHNLNETNPKVVKTSPDLAEFNTNLDRREPESNETRPNFGRLRTKFDRP